MKFLSKLLFLTSAAIVLSCATTGEPLNVLIIAVDTLRPDHLGCYGYGRNTSPNIDRLASEGILFENVVSQSPWTLPSFATVFTSLYPTQHGAGTLKSRMRTSFPPLAMILLKRGYSTGAIINAPALKCEFGVDRGFEFYDVNPPAAERTADQVTKDALRWIDLNKDNPFFFFVHYFDPHLSYSPPAPYDTLFDPQYEGPIGNSFDLSQVPRARVTNFETMKMLTSADWDHIKALYDGEIAFADEAIGELVNGLEGLGLRRSTLIVFLSDHGEEFFEHEGFEHGHTLFDELLKVPLILSLPRVLPQNVRFSDQVRLLDVAPTIFDLLNIHPETHLEGVSLKPLIMGKAKVKASSISLLPHEVAYAEALLYGRERKSVTAYPWKLIYDTVTKEEMLFNLEHDPGEKENLISQELHPRALLEEILFKTLFGISDTWYIELAGAGEGHTFDVEITAEREPMAGRINLYKLLDEDGRIVDLEEIGSIEASQNTLKLKGVTLRRSLTLAFKTNPKRAPLSFDLRIDGQPAIDRTFLGEGLSRPDQMPFTQRVAPHGQSKGMPSAKPQAPYVLVWHSGTEFEGETPVELDEETKKELRALGYIQ